jgi:hypothetical protein
MTRTQWAQRALRPDRPVVVPCTHHLADDPAALACTLPRGHTHGCVYVGMTVDDVKHADAVTQEET